MNKANFIINKGSSIRQALKKIDKNKKGTILVTENEINTDAEKEFSLFNALNVTT